MKADRVPASNLKNDFSKERTPPKKPVAKSAVGGGKKKASKVSEPPPKAPPLSAEELRRKRDAERLDLRRMISEKRNEKAEMMRQRAEERQEAIARRAQEQDEMDLAKARVSGSSGATTDHSEHSSAKEVSPNRSYIIYGTNDDPALTPDNNDKDEDVVESFENCVKESSIRGNDSIDLLEDLRVENDPDSEHADIPEYVTAEALRGKRDERVEALPPPPIIPTPAQGGESAVTGENGEKHIRFKDFLGREYTPLGTAEGQGEVVDSDTAGSSREVHSSSSSNVAAITSTITTTKTAISKTPLEPPGQSNVIMYSRDDIDVDRKRRTMDQSEKDAMASTSCCSRISSLFVAKEEQNTSSRRLSGKRSSSSVSPAPADSADRQDGEGVAGQDIEDDGNRSGGDGGHREIEDEYFSDGDSDASSSQGGNDYGSMLLAMEDALGLPDKQLVLNEDGAEEDDDVFEEDSDSNHDDSDGDDDDNDEVEGREVEGGDMTGSSWGDADDDCGQENGDVEEISEILKKASLTDRRSMQRGGGEREGEGVNSSGTGKKSPTPLYAYAALQGKVSPHRPLSSSSSTRPEDRHTIDDEGVIATDPNGDDIIRLAEGMLAKNIREMEATGRGAAGEDGEEEEESSMGSSWGSGSEEGGELGDDLGEGPGVGRGDGGAAKHDVTIYGVPFPLGQTARHDVGISFGEEDSPALKMEALREYLEDSLGLDKFIKAYRLLKSIGPSDEDDDSLLSNMEQIVGVEGLQYMDTFIQLITIEERFENT